MTDQKTSGSCCSTDGSCHSGAASDVQGVGVTTVYKVSGMTCGHCEG
ncbi:copper-binding protein, partial [Streptomyces sp. NPDC006386]